MFKDTNILLTSASDGIQLCQQDLNFNMVMVRDRITLK